MSNGHLEKMGDFFNNRIDGYEEHQKKYVDGGEELYDVTASLLPKDPRAEILDLGCGTGLELDAYFPLNPTASVTGIDLADKLTEELLQKHADKNIEVILGSYFDEPFGTALYDAAVSVMSLHHFTKEQKIPLYRKLKDALKPGGIFVLTDYLAPDEAWEERCFAELARRKAEEGIEDDEFYHFDTPLTAAHETEALRAGGFTEIRIRANWGNTYVIAAK